MSNEDNLDARVKDLESEVQNQEQKLIEQEHRIVRIVTNIFQTFDQYPKGDTRRSAAVRALLWRVFSPATAAFGMSGFAAIVGLYVAWQSNSILQEQNRLISSQNILSESGRRSSLIVELSEVNNDLRDATKAASSRARIPEQYRYSIPTNCEAKNSPTSLDIDGKSKHIAYERQNLALKTQVEPPQALIGRVVALSRAFKPYQYLDQELSHSLTGLLSPERAQLLVSLITAGVATLPFHARGADFSYSDFRDANLNTLDFSNARLISAEFTGAQLVASNLRYSNLMSSRFVDANAICADFFGSDLRYIDARQLWLNGANLRCAKVSSETLKDASIENTDLRGARYQTKGGMDKLVTKEWLREIGNLSDGAIVGETPECKE